MCVFVCVLSLAQFVFLPSILLWIFSGMTVDSPVFLGRSRIDGGSGKMCFVGSPLHNARFQDRREDRRQDHRPPWGAMFFLTPQKSTAVSPTESTSRTAGRIRPQDRRRNPPPGLHAAAKPAVASSIGGKCQGALPPLDPQ